MKALRKANGFTQQDLADYLGIHRSDVANAEDGRRELPTKHLMKLSRLQLADMKIEAAALEIDIYVAAGVKKALAEHAARCLQKAEQYEQKWREHEATFLRHRRKLRLLEILRTTATEPLTTFDEKWIDLHEFISQSALSDEELRDAAMLKFKGEMLRLEAEKALELSK